MSTVLQVSYNEINHHNYHLNIRILYYTLLTLFVETTGSVGVIIGEPSDYMLEFSPEYVLTFFDCLNISNLSSCEYTLSESCPSNSYGLISCYYG